MLDKLKAYIKENIVICVLIPPVAAALIISAAVCGLSFWKLLPLLFSLAVMLMHSSAIRAAFLLGGLNSVLYAAVYVTFTLYSSAASAFFVSFPSQMLTFLSWNKRKYKGSTSFRRLTARTRLLAGGAAIVIYIALYFIFGLFGSAYMMIDNINLICSLLMFVLSVFSFVEYPYFLLAGSVVSLITNLTVLGDDISILPYVIYGVYAIICGIRSVISVHRLYDEQHKKQA